MSITMQRRHHMLLMKRVLTVMVIAAGWIMIYRSFGAVQKSDRYALQSGNGHPGKILNCNRPYFRNEDKIRKDWHDYGNIQLEQLRSGPGENGTAVDVSSFDPIEVKRAMGLGGINDAVSRHISVNRSLPDIRHPE